MKWGVSNHAKESVMKRFNIQPQHVVNYVNQMMENCVEVYCAEEDRKAYAHKTKDFFAVVGANNNTVITVIDKAPEQVAVRTPFIDALLPKLERELFKMERDFKRKRRAIDREIAEKTVERGEALRRRANVYHPKTQAILQAQADTYEQEIAELYASIAPLETAYEMAAVKLRRFIWTSAGR